MVLRRRTAELGFRTEQYESDYYQIVAGIRGSFLEDYNYNASYQYGESNRTTIRAGYTNLTNIQNALRASTNAAGEPECTGGDSSCVPIDLFGGFGTITPAMAAYAQAIALQQQKYTQEIFTGSVGGTVEAARLPSADNAPAFNVGFERRDETGSLEPDECLKLAPASCQGGAGGNLLPIAGGFKVDEVFGEFIYPLVENKPGASSLHLEAGYRSSDYNTVGSHDTWKAGVNWRPIDNLLVRIMVQEAIRAPNVDELFAPEVTGLDNAQLDPCSSKNVANLNDALRALCISTGMTAAQVGVVDDVISNQIQILQGADLSAPPSPETASTQTLGLVWTPDFNWGPAGNLVLSLDYYDIDIEDIIGEFSAQEILNACYEGGIAGECAKINRRGGGLTLAGAGVDLYTTNLLYLQAEGLELGISFDVDLDNAGVLQFSGTINSYMTHESQSGPLTPVLECKGHIATDCDGVFDIRWIGRVIWNWQDLTVSGQWRHLGDLTVPDRERGQVFQAFRKVDAYDYFDLYASYRFWEDRMAVSFGVENITDEEPPIVGQDIGDTGYNFGNTLPSHYDVFGLTYNLSFKFTY